MGRAKWVARGMYGAVLSLALGLAWWTLHEDAEVPLVATPSVARPVARPPPPPPPERGDDGAPVDAPPPVLVAPAPVVLPSPPTTPPATGPRLPNHPVDQEALARETALINRARAEVTSEPQTALKTLTDYHQQFPRGELTQDEELIRVEALLRLGRRQEAETLARKLTGRDGSMKKSLERLLADVRPN